MLEKGKISARQMGMVMYFTIVSTAILVVPGVTAKDAKQDMWLSPIWASVPGAISVYIAYKLHKIYPQKTVIQYSEIILGKVIGKVIGFLYIFASLFYMGQVLRLYADFVIGSFLPKTPMIVVLTCMVLVCSFVVHSGIEVLARVTEFFFPIFVVLFVLLFLLLVPELEVRHMFPIMENGMMPSLKGTITPMLWISQIFLMTFFLPFLSNQAKAVKNSIIFLLVAVTIMVLTNLTSLFIFGNMTSTVTYPVMSAGRYISVAEFLEHLESIVMAIWISSVFIYTSALYYVTVLGTAQWLNLTNYRPIIFPFGLLAVLFAIWIAPNVQTISHYYEMTGVIYDMLMLNGIPILLLLIAVIREKFKNRIFEESK